MIKENCIEIKFGQINAYIFKAKVKDILQLYYIAVRGKDDIEGAVQRVLSQRRINSIVEFILRDNMFFNTFILNWTETNFKPNINSNIIEIPITPGAAQVIDGQHRLEGLKKAYEKNDNIGDNDILIVLTQNITTKEAAQIFLNINSEQKPVPKSLIYDLFGEIKDRDFHIVRAKELAEKMHSDMDSALYQLIKMPGAPTGSGKIDLSAFVGGLKDYLNENQTFQLYNLNDFETQFKIINNFFTVIKNAYEINDLWLSNKNPFFTNAGFYAASKFLCEDLIPKCAMDRSFSVDKITKILPFFEMELLQKDDIKNIAGREQRIEIYNYIKSILLREVPSEDEYEL